MALGRTFTPLKCDTPSRHARLLSLSALVLQLPFPVDGDSVSDTSAAGPSRPSATPCHGLPTRTVRVPVSGDGSDAFQVKKSGVSYTSNSGEVYMGRSAYHGNVISALRFANVSVPMGARIEATSARLVDAHTGERCCTGDDLTVLLRFEEAGNSTLLPSHQTEGWFLSRLAMTSSQSWQPPTSHAYTAIMTPDLSRLVQVVVDLEDWVAGNAMTLLMDGEGQKKDLDKRTYFGSATHFDEHRAILSITYCEPGSNASAEEGEHDDTVVAAAPACPPAADCPKCSSSSPSSGSVAVFVDESTDGNVTMHLASPKEARGPRIPATTTAVVGCAMLLAGVATLSFGCGTCSAWDEESEGV